MNHRHCLNCHHCKMRIPLSTTELTGANAIRKAKGDLSHPIVQQCIQEVRKILNKKLTAMSHKRVRCAKHQWVHGGNNTHLLNSNGKDEPPAWAYREAGECRFFDGGDG